MLKKQNTHINVVLLLIISASFGFQLNAQVGLDFDGTNDYVQTTYGGITGTNDRTVEAWIKAPANSTQKVIVDWGSMTLGQRFTLNMINSKLRCEIGGQGMAGTTTVADNQWHHVAVTYDNNATTKFRLYVDGVQDAAFNLTNVTMNTSSTTNVRFGVRVDGANYFDGVIDEVRIWNTVRTQQEISGNINVEFCTAQSGLVAYHKLNDGVPGVSNTGQTTSTDYSGSSNNGTLNGFSLSGSTSNWATGNVTGATITTNAADTVCDSLVSSTGNFTWYTSGNYSDTASSYMGCDSITALELTVLSSTSASMSVTECEVYTGPSGNNNWTQSGTYQDIIPNAAGCDSVITIQLTINNSFDTIYPQVCASYTSPSGNYVWNQAGTYYDTIGNAAGCDSVLRIELELLASFGSETVTACGQYEGPSGQQSWTQSGIYSDTISNANGCDSIISVDLTILALGNSSVVVSECESYESPSGLYNWSTSGIYTDTLQAANGCDSIITIDLTIDTTEAIIKKKSNKLEATATAFSYQWLDCDEGMSPISGELSQSFKPTGAGNYAVVLISSQGCRDTSDCKNFKPVGIVDLANDYGLLVYPNPTADAVIIEAEIALKSENVMVFNALGEQVIAQVTDNANSLRVFLPKANGVYLIQITTLDGAITQPVLRH